MRPGDVEVLELRDDGGTLYGTLIQEGRAASRLREIVAPGAVEWPSEGVGVMVKHYGAVEVRAIPERHPDGRITLQARATDAIRAAVAAGSRFMSIEFDALKERRTAGGIREILRALVPGVALVPNPEYVQTGAEVRTEARARISYSTLIRRATILDCKCLGSLGTKNVGSIEFGADAFSDMVKQVKAGRNVSAISGGAGDVVADTATGSLTLTDGKRGLEIGIVALGTRAGREFGELAAAGVNVYARPILDRDESEFKPDGDLVRVKRAVFNSILIKPTPNARGQKPLRAKPEGRAAAIPWERRRLLL